jgi:hypothetical protein
MMLLDEQMHSLEKTIKENQEKLANDFSGYDQ